MSSARAKFGSAGEEFREALHLLAVGYAGSEFIVVARALFEWLARTGDAADTLSARTELAHCMIKEDDREQGLALLDDLLPELLAGRPLLLAEALNGIGNSLIESGHPGDALPLYQLVEQVRRAAGDSHKLAECLYNLGCCYHDLKDHAPAAACLSEALDRFRNGLGETHPYVAEAGFRLGVSCHRLGDYPKAVAAYRVVVRCRKLAKSDADTSVVVELIRLAELGLPPAGLPAPTVPDRPSPFAALTHGMDRATARRYGTVVRRFYSRDYAGCAELALKSLPGGLARYDVINLLVCSLERLVRADFVPAVGSWAIAISAGSPFQHLIRYVVGQADIKTVRGQVAGHVGQNTVDMAVALKLATAGDTEGAAGYLAEITARSPRTFEGISSLVERHLLGVPPGPPSDAAREAIGELVRRLGRQQALGRDRERVDRLTAEGRYDEAVALQERLCRELEAGAGLDPVPYATALNNLAHILFKAGRYAESLPYYERCVEVLRAVPDAPEAGDAANNLGNTYLELGLAADAVRCHEDAIALRIKAYGNHPRVLLGYLDLASAYRAHDPSRRRSVYEGAVRCVADGLGPRYPRLASRTAHAVSQALARDDHASAHQAIREVMLTWEGLDELSHSLRDMLAAGIAEGAEGRAERAKNFLEYAAKRAAEQGDAGIVSAALIELGANEFREGRWADASKLAAQALTTARTVKGDPSVVLMGRALLLSARCVVKQGGEAEQAFDMLARVAAAGNVVEGATRVSARMLAAQVRLRRGHTPQALEELTVAVRETASLPAPDALTALSSIGSLFQSCGDAAGVSDCLARAQALVPSADDVDGAALAALLALRCSQALSAGEYGRADEDCQHALCLLAEASPPAPALRARLLEDHGLIAILRRRDMAAAAEAYTLAVGELDKCPDDVAYEKARLRVTLAKALAGCGNLTRASDTIRTAYEELERLVRDSHGLLADALGTAGRINLSIGARQTAESQLTRARQIFSDLLGPGHEMVVHLNIDLSLLHAAEGRWANALAEARAAVGSLSPSSDELALKCRRVEALANYALGNVAPALQGLVETLAGRTALYLRVARLASNAERVRMADSVRTVLDELLAAAWEAGAVEDPVWAGPLFLAAARSRRLATELLSRQEAALRGAGDAAKWAELRELRMLHARTALANPTRPLDERAREQLKTIQQRIDHLEVELYASAPDVLGSAELDRVTTENLAAQLGPGQALVAFVSFPAISPVVLTRDVPGLKAEIFRYVAFVLRRPAPTARPPSGPSVSPPARKSRTRSGNSLFFSKAAGGRALP